jgi:leader peptidase (prepilin peptidase) / N-methyltransferase
MNPALSEPMDSVTSQLVIVLMKCLTVCWWFAVGASVGSFLNVVVYRLPRGKSVVSTPSACPQCGTRLSKADNVPIFGWLRLKGRCRTCQWSIPPRYVLMELLVGCQFVGLLLWEVTTGGWNLPVREPNFYAGIVWTVWWAMYPALLGTFVLHLVWLCSAATLTLMAMDGQRAPVWLWVGLWVTLSAGLLFWPDLQPLLLTPVTLPRTMSMAMGAPWIWLTGTLSGIVCGGVVSLLGRRQPSAAVDRMAAWGLLVLAGTVLGPAGALSTAVLTAVMWTGWAGWDGVAFLRRSAPLSTLVCVCSHVQLVFWRWLSSSPGWPGHVTPLTDELIIFGVLLAAAIVLPRQLPGLPGRSSPTDSEVDPISLAQCAQEDAVGASAPIIATNQPPATPVSS